MIHGRGTLAFGQTSFAFLDLVRDCPSDEASPDLLVSFLSAYVIVARRVVQASMCSDIISGIMCPQVQDKEPYGVDPIFLPTSELYRSDLDVVRDGS